MATSAPLTSHASCNHWALRTQADAHATWVLSYGQIHSILLYGVESIHRLSHQRRVRDGMTNVTGPLVVQDGSLLLTWHLDSLDSALITAREGHLVTVHDNIFVALQEVHLEAPSVDHGRAQIDVGWVQASIDCIVVT